MTVAVFSIFLGPLSLVTAPIAIGLALFYWNKIKTPYPRGKWRFVVTLVVASFLFIGWGLWLLDMVWG